MNVIKNNLDDKIYGLLGKGISHSFSKKLHSYFGKYKYELFDLDEAKAKDLIVSKNYSGLNITMPYKRLAYSLCDELSYTAKSVGSVNTIINKNNLLYGYNTDYDGFKSLINTNKIEISGKKVMILGSGGASATIQAVIKEMNAESVIVISRSGDNNYKNIERNYDADIIINTTPVGMFPNLNCESIDISKFKKCKDVIDIIYNPLRTRLLCKSKFCGKNIFNGLPMLLFQGIEASCLFTGKNIKINANQIGKKIRKVKENIILIGMPGVGKTTLGRMIAAKLGMEYIDTDSLIHNSFGEKPENIIKYKGEKLFRDLEKRIINEVYNKEFSVISTGGGVVLDEENMLSLMSNGRVFFIKRDFELINKGCGAALRAGGIEELYSQRKIKYKKYCDFEIYNNFSVDKTVADIISRCQM